MLERVEELARREHRDSLAKAGEVWVSGDEGVDSCGPGKGDQVLVVGVVCERGWCGFGVVEGEALVTKELDVRFDLVFGCVAPELLPTEDLFDLGEEVRRDDELEGAGTELEQKLWRWPVSG